MRNLQQLLQQLHLGAGGVACDMDGQADGASLGGGCIELEEHQALCGLVGLEVRLGERVVAQPGRATPPRFHLPV